MNNKRTHINITFPRKARRKQLSSWLDWFKVFKGRETSDPIDNNKRDQLITIVKSMRDKVYSPEAEELFTKHKLKPPYAFEMMGAYTLATDTQYDAEEIVISGMGKHDSLLKWLQLEKYQYTVSEI
jgi:hypothetical protein